jgi:hypothetical protein
MRRTFDFMLAELIPHRRPLFLLKESFDNVATEEWHPSSGWQDADAGLGPGLPTEVAAMCAGVHESAAHIPLVR